MKKEFMSALICAFSRAYHSKINKVKIFDDPVAKLLLSDEKYNEIAEHMSKGIQFFNPQFNGNRDEALRWIVDNYLSPSPLGRAAYTVDMLEKGVCNGGVEQYLIFAAGYDSFAYNQPKWAEKLDIFEIDHPSTGADKMERLKRADIRIPSNVNYISADFTKEKWIKSLTGNELFSKDKISFCSVLGLAYYLTKDDFKKMLKIISEVVPSRSIIIFDYPDEDAYSEQASDRAKKQIILAGGAGEKMLAGYSCTEMNNVLNECGFRMDENLTPEEITKIYFSEYNKANPDHYMSAFDNVNYCMAVRK